MYVSHAQENAPCDVEGEFFHNTLDCSTYFWCVHGEKKLMNCGPGTKFNLNLETCTWPEQSTCVEEQGTIEQECLYNPTAIIPHPTECQLFYNCSLVYNPGPRVFEQHMDECYYPDLFNTATMQCEYFENVDCGTRTEHVDACSYRRSWCPVAHCMPCFVGSCRCKTDGQHANEKRLWSPWYTECYKERALDNKYCPPDSNGIAQLFHPWRELCLPLYLIPKEHRGTMPICNEKIDGNYYDVDYGCGQYAVCYGSELQERVQCDDGWVFDFVMRNCRLKQEACGFCGDVKLENCNILS